MTGYFWTADRIEKLKELYMIALTDKQCKFAVSDAPYEFCGLPSKAGSWLCEKHHALCYQPNAPRRAA